MRKSPVQGALKKGSPTLACHCALITEHKEQDLTVAVQWQVFLCYFKPNEASMSLIKIAGQNRIFSSLGIEAINLLKLYSLWDSKMS